MCHCFAVTRLMIFQFGDATTIRREIGKSILTGSSDVDNDTPSRNGAAAPFLETINHGRTRVFLDRPLLGGPVFQDNFQRFLSTLKDGGQTPILSKLGQALAVDSDILGMQLAIKACAPSGVGGYIDWSTASAANEKIAEFLPTTVGESWFVDANAMTDGSALLDGLRQVKEYWDTENVPDSDRVAFLKPASTTCWCRTKTS